MPRFEPFPGVRYDLAAVAAADVTAPPYDVLDADDRAALVARHPHNVVVVDLPVDGDDPYGDADRTFRRWLDEGVLVRDEPAFYVYRMSFTDDAGVAHHTTGVVGALELSRPGEGGILPHEQTTKKAKTDRLDLLRATRANLSAVWGLSPAAGLSSLLESDDAPTASWTDDDGVDHAYWVVDDPARVDAIAAAIAAAPVLIADGHHRYETARVYAEEIGGEGEHRYVLMLLVALEDPGLTVFPTHRLVSGLADDPAKQEALAAALRAHFTVAELASADELAPPEGETVRIGYVDGHVRRPFMLTLSDDAAVAAALPGASDAYRHLDTAVLEALVLKGALGLSEDDISHFRGLGYARSFAEARALVDDGTYDAAFYMAPTPVTRIAV